MIPKHIILTSQIRPQAYINHLQALNPGFEILFFDDQQCIEFIAQHFDNKVLNAYNKILPSAYKADIFRYCALYQLGGIYTDIDIPYNQSFSSLWNLSENYLHLIRDAGNNMSIQISTMAAPANASYFKLCLDTAISNIEHSSYAYSPYSITGPQLAGNCLVQYIGENIRPFGKITQALNQNDLPVSIQYRLVSLQGEAREKLSRTAFVNINNQIVFPYKLNKDRTNWNSPLHYYNAWHNKTVYAENN